MTRVTATQIAKSLIMNTCPSCGEGKLVNAFDNYYKNNFFRCGADYADNNSLFYREVERWLRANGRGDECVKVRRDLEENESSFFAPGVTCNCCINCFRKCRASAEEDS